MTYGMKLKNGNWLICLFEPPASLWMEAQRREKATHTIF